jgi:hypothetical protein
MAEAGYFPCLRDCGSVERAICRLQDIVCQVQLFADKGADESLVRLASTVREQNLSGQSDLRYIRQINLVANILNPVPVPLYPRPYSKYRQQNVMICPARCACLHT